MPFVPPTVDDVALLLRTRTMSPAYTGLGGDTAHGDFTTFTDDSRPSRAEVERMIVMATGAVAGRVGGLPANETDVLHGLVQHAVAVYAAMWVEASFFREQFDYTWWQTLLDDLIGGGGEGEPGEQLKAYTFGEIYVGTIMEPKVAAELPTPDPLPWHLEDEPLRKDGVLRPVIKLEIKAAGDEDIERDLREVSQRIENWDHVAQQVFRRLEREERAIFAGYGGKYVRTGRLRKSLTRKGGRDALREAHGTTITFGSRVPYARYMQAHVLVEGEDKKLQHDLAQMIGASIVEPFG